MIPSWNLQLVRFFKRNDYGLILFVVICLNFPTLTTLFDQPDPLVHFDPSSTAILIGEREQVDLVIKNANQLYGFEVRIRFDPDVVQVVDQDQESPGAQIAPGDFYNVNQGFLVVNKADNDVGEIIFAFTLLAPAVPLNGDGILLSIEIQGIKEGTNPLELVSMILANKDGESLPLSTSDGEISVITDQDVEPSDTPTKITSTLSQTKPAISVTSNPTQTLTPSTTQEPLPSSTHTARPTSTLSIPEKPSATSVDEEINPPETETQTPHTTTTEIVEINQTSRGKFEAGWILIGLFLVVFFLLRTARRVIQKDD
jgi:hypothetical protein